MKARDRRGAFLLAALVQLSATSSACAASGPPLQSGVDRAAFDQNVRRQVLADTHAWSEFRVNGPVSNIPAFYEGFAVKAGDALFRAPDARGMIW